MQPATHRHSTATIKLDNLTHNIQMIKKHIPKDRLFYAVVKADAYGHGAVPVALHAQKSGVDGFCVALLDEAIELRKAGITKPILVLGITPIENAYLAAQFDVALTVSDSSFIKDAQQYVFEKPIAIHLKLNTGMNRIGVQSEEEVKLFEMAVLSSDQFILEGVYTHFATADGENEEKVNQQYNLFQKLIKALSQRPKYVHVANSAMTIWRSDFASDIARVGIAMYGVNPSDKTLQLPYPLKPVLSWTTQVIFVHAIKKGETVSYGAKYVAQEDEWIATLPVGYADGWRRSLGTQSVVIHDKKYPIVGVVCMDQMMVKIPKEIKVGDTVELIGDINQVTELAVNIKTIGYELLCGISDRVPRVYTN